MYEDGLGKVMADVEAALATPEEEATRLQRTQYAEENGRFEEKKGKLFTRMPLATSHGGFPRGAWQCRGPSRASVRSGRNTGVPRWSWCGDGT